MLHFRLELTVASTVGFVHAMAKEGEVGDSVIP
jgi:hypothetical protein